MGIWSKDNIKKSWSSYWASDYIYEDDSYSWWKGSTAEREHKKNTAVSYRRSTSELLRLANIRRGVANFVKILCDKDIPVQFSSGVQSKTDGQRVIISAWDKPEMFDVMVGTALHEASHILLSQRLFTLVPFISQTSTIVLKTSAYATNASSEFGKLWALYSAKFFNGTDEHDAFNQLVADFHLVMNVLEDRYIDDFVYRTAPGYRPYYESMYSAYFYSPEINAMLLAPAPASPMVKDYTLHLINMFNRYANADALPGLRKIHNIVDLKNISRYGKEDAKWSEFLGKTALYPAAWFENPLPEFLRNAIEILYTIYENATVDNTSSVNNSLTCGESADGSGSGSTGDEESDLPNLDSDSGEVGKVPTTQEQIDAIKKQVRRILQGITKEKLEATDAKNMAQLENSGATLVNVGEGVWNGAKVPCVVYTTLNENTIKHTPFGGYHSVGSSEDAITKGIAMGNVLAHRLRIMNDESTMRMVRQEHGRIDKRMIASLGFGYDRVFATDHVVKLKPVLLDISLDNSGSMIGTKWNEALMVAVALCTAATKIRSLRVRVNLRASENSSAVVGIIYDSSVDNLTKVRKMFPMIYPNSTTPEGLCYEALEKMLSATAKDVRRYFLNISDGLPEFFGEDATGRQRQYSGDEAFAHTRRQVENIRRSGVKVLSYYVGNHSISSSVSNRFVEGFKKMYGPTAEFIKLENVSDIARTLNRMFLEE